MFAIRIILDRQQHVFLNRYRDIAHSVIVMLSATSFIMSLNVLSLKSADNCTYKSPVLRHFEKSLASDEPSMQLPNQYISLLYDQYVFSHMLFVNNLR